MELEGFKVARRHFDKDRDQRREQDRLVARARRGERDILSIPNDVSLLRPPLAADSISMRARRLMLEAEDRRQYHPESEFAPAKRLDGRPTRGVRVATVPKKRTVGVRKIRVYRENILPWQVAFKDPKRLLVCIRRRIRREVLHAFKLTGKGSGSAKRFNQFSGIRC